MKLPLGNSQFRILLAVFLANGIASAIPATLVLFYIRDGLGLERYAGLILTIYFIAAAGAIPGWVALARRTRRGARLAHWHGAGGCGVHLGIGALARRSVRL